MKLLYKHIGGSRAYGLHTDDSDIDYRGVFCNTEVAQILGLQRFDHISSQKDGDSMMYEVRHFFELLRKGNTSALEILFSKDALETSDVFREIQQNSVKFLDSEKTFKSLRGYILGERELAVGKRTGEMGSKRRAQIEKYGFSPKNFVQIFRLIYCGVTLFTKGYFPVNIPQDDPVVGATLLRIKTRPELYTLTPLMELVNEGERALELAFQKRSFDYKFDNKFANNMLKAIYLPYLYETT